MPKVVPDDEKLDYYITFNLSRRAGRDIKTYCEKNNISVCLFIRSAVEAVLAKTKNSEVVKNSREENHQPNVPKKRDFLEESRRKLEESARKYISQTSVE